MVEMPVLQHIPVTGPHPAETRMDDPQLVRRRRREAFDQFDHDLPIPFPTETWRVERARRRLNPSFRPRQTVDGQVAQDRATDSTGRRAFEFPLAQRHTQATCQVRQELNGLHPTPSTRMLRSERAKSVENRPSPGRITKRAGNHVEAPPKSCWLTPGFSRGGSLSLLPPSAAKPCETARSRSEPC